MRSLQERTIRWGISGTPWTHDIEAHRAALGTCDFRSNWCRLNPAQWSTDTHNAGQWSLTDNANLATEIISRGGRCVEVLVDRQQVLGGEANSARMNIAKAIATWDSQQLSLLRDEVRSVRAAMPNETYGELWNGDEFGPGCGFAWDPMLPEFWKRLGLTMPKGSTIRSRFTRFGNEIAAIWGHPVILSSSHVYMYPGGSIAHRGARVHPVCTEVGVHANFFDQPETVIRLNNALIANGVTWAFWHQPYPGNPGDGGAFQSGNKFMYDRKAFESWLRGRDWPEWDGVLLRDAASALQLAMRSAV